MREFQECDDLGVDPERVADVAQEEVHFDFTGAVGDAVDEIDPDRLMADFMDSISVDEGTGANPMAELGYEMPEDPSSPEDPRIIDGVKRAIAGLVSPQDQLPAEPPRPASEMTLVEKAQRAAAGIVYPQDQLPPESRRPDEGVVRRAGHAIAGLVSPQDQLPAEPLKPASEMTLRERIQRAAAGLIEPQGQLPPDPPMIDACLSGKVADSVAGLVVPQDNKPRS
ncbi:MAG TPA: hypothetical protein VF809_00720 [Candidatus Saccharimonadales bacterium]